jgi:hypothetical protein
VTSMAALTAGVNRPGATADLGPGGPPAARTSGPAGGDRPAVISSGTRTVRSWPLLVLAAPAAAEVWSGWVGIAQKTGFGLVSPPPGILPSLHLDTSITLPVGVEAYAAYALRAWLADQHAISGRTQRFAKWSAICSFALGMAGQVAYHLLAQAGAARAPWPVTTIVSCLPVLVLAMGTTLAHMLRADAGTAADGPDNGTGGPAVSRFPAWSAEDQAGAAQDRAASQAPLAGSGPPAGTTTAQQDHDARAATAIPSGIGQARMAASRLAATGRPVSRRALRSEGIKGSNQALNALARTINAEPAGTAVVPARPGNVGTERASRPSLGTTRVSPGADGGERLVQAGPGPCGAGQGLVEVDPVRRDAGRGEDLALRGEVLQDGRAPGVADGFSHPGSGRLASPHRTDSRTTNMRRHYRW